MSGTTSGVDFTSRGEDTHMRVFRGKTISFEIIWGGNSPIDITGYTASLQVRNLQDKLMLEFSTNNGRISVGGTDGTFTFAGSEDDTRAINNVGHWELELTTPGGEVFRALSGTATPIMEISQ